MCVSGGEGCLNVFLFISHSRGRPGEASGHEVTQHTGLVRFTKGSKVLACLLQMWRMSGFLD